MAASNKGLAGIGRGLPWVCQNPGPEDLRRKGERGEVESTHSTPRFKNLGLALSNVSIFFFNRLSVFLLKPFNPACGVHKFLFARKEGMAIRTDFHMDLLLRTPCLKDRATGAFDHRLINLGVDILFHLHSLRI
jgi:hypothetical protein